jgi:hypothetical protein
MQRWKVPQCNNHDNHRGHRGHKGMHIFSLKTSFTDRTCLCVPLCPLWLRLLIVSLFV